MNFYARTVTRQFRAELAGLLPGLGDNQAYFAMTQHLLFGTWLDRDTGNLLIPRELVAAIEGKSLNADYVAHTFLDAYRRDVLDFTVTDWQYGQGGHCRSVAALALPAAVEALVAVERLRTPRTHPDRVWMPTGRTWFRKQAVKKRQEAREEAMCVSRDAHPASRPLLAYMNALPGNRFTTALTHLPEAIRAAETVPSAWQQLNLLGMVADQPQPFYVPSSCTRIFTRGSSLLHLHRSVRQVLTQDWVTADLRSAQLAIVARLWDVPLISDYLRSGSSIWADLCAHMGLAYTEDHKDAMKQALYSATYGAGARRITAGFTKALGGGEARYQRFSGHPVVSALLEARGGQLSLIRRGVAQPGTEDREPGALDAFGVFIPMDTVPRDDYEFSYDTSRSVLACVAQSYELQLLLPVLDLALAHRDHVHGFALTTWLHDGFSFDCKARDRLSWQDRLSRAVERQADLLGIETRLEFS